LYYEVIILVLDYIGPVIAPALVAYSISITKPFGNLTFASKQVIITVRFCFIWGPLNPREVLYPPVIRGYCMMDQVGVAFADVEHHFF
jgi:hypothetical protein